MVKGMTNHNRANSRIQPIANNCSDEMLIMAPCIVGGCVAINQASILEQREKLLPKRINSFHWLHWKKISPAVFISSIISFSVFPTFIGPGKSKVVTVISGKLRFCSLCKLQIGKQAHSLLFIFQAYTQLLQNIRANRLQFYYVASTAKNYFAKIVVICMVSLGSQIVSQPT